MGHWKKTTHKLPESHGWRCTKGYNLVILNRGALQVEYPDTWINVPAEGNVLLHDKLPPEGDYVLQISVMQLPPLRDERPSIEYLLISSMLSSGIAVIPADAKRFAREDVEIVWAEYSDVDVLDGQPLIRKHAFCHSGTTFGVLTFGHRPDLREESEELWFHILRTLIMERWVDDPIRGPVIH